MQFPSPHQIPSVRTHTVSGSSSTSLKSEVSNHPLVGLHYSRLERAAAKAEALEGHTPRRLLRRPDARGALGVGRMPPTRRQDR